MRAPIAVLQLRGKSRCNQCAIASSRGCGTDHSKIPPSPQSKIPHRWSESMLRMYKIMKARPEDISSLPVIELAAAKLLLGYAPKKVLEETTSQDELHHAQRLGLLWLAVHEDRPVGFAHVKLIEANAVHLQEIDVHPEHGRRGLGTNLIREVCSWAANTGFSSITLTTFRTVPWNMPWYLRLGFEAVSPDELGPALLSILREEELRGLDPKTRVAMRRSSDRISQPIAV
jgi:GNAT superfamily N-acetyltransferase